MNLQEILIIIMVVFIIGFTIFSVIDTASSKKERVTKIREAKNENELLTQIKRECKKNKWEIDSIMLLEKTDDYIKAIVIFEVR